MSAWQDVLANRRACLLAGHVVLLPSPWEDGKNRPHLVWEVDGAEASVIPVTHARPGECPGDVCIGAWDKRAHGLDPTGHHLARAAAFRVQWRRRIPLSDLARAGRTMTPTEGIPARTRARILKACNETPALRPTAAGESPRPPARRPPQQEG